MESLQLGTILRRDGQVVVSIFGILWRIIWMFIMLTCKPKLDFFQLIPQHLSLLSLLGVPPLVTVTALHTCVKWSPFMTIIGICFSFKFSYHFSPMHHEHTI